MIIQSVGQRREKKNRSRAAQMDVASVCHQRGQRDAQESEQS